MDKKIAIVISIIGIGFNIIFYFLREVVEKMSIAVIITGLTIGSLLTIFGIISLFTDKLWRIIMRIHWQLPITIKRERSLLQTDNDIEAYNTLGVQNQELLDKYKRLINYDRAHLREAEIITKFRCEFPGCNQVSGGVIVFKFDIFNGSIFQVEIGAQIEGNLTATCGHFLNRIELAGLEIIDHICSGMIVLQQPILPELCKDINQKALRPGGYEVTFNFENLKIYINESNSTVAGNLQLLKLPKTLTYNIKLHEIKSGESVFGEYKLDLIQETNDS